MGGYSSNGQTSLKNNKTLREKNRWKFDDINYPMPDAYGNSERSYNEKRMKEAGKKKLYRTVFEYAFMIALMLSIFIYVFTTF